MLFKSLKADDTVQSVLAGEWNTILTSLLMLWGLSFSEL